MCGLCENDKKMLRKMSDDIRGWLIDNEFYYLCDNEHESAILSKGFPEGNPVDIYGSEYESFSSRISNIFKEQQKTFNANLVVNKLFEFRPITKTNAPIDELGKFLEKLFLSMGFLASTNPGNKKLNDKFNNLINDISVYGYNFGGNDALKNIKRAFKNSKNQYVKEIADSIKTSFNLTNKDTLNYLSRYSADRVTQINNTTKQKLRDIIVTEYKKGTVPKEIVKSIKLTFDDFSDKRAKSIAFTELSISSGEARYESYIRRNVSGKRWLARGGKVCVICQENARAGVIDINKEFPSGNLTDPAHPNCACTIVPEIGDYWCGGADMSKSVFQSEDRCQGYTWYGGTGNEKTS